MPRKNKSRSHTPYIAFKNDQNKRRYTSELAAEKSAEESMAVTPNLKLTVYRGLDGGWYLTSKK